MIFKTVVLASSVAGVIFDQVWPLLTIAFALYSARHLYHLIDVPIWLHHGTGPRA